jgi:hypothetical protein
MPSRILTSASLGGDRVETALRFFFPKDGKYHLKIYIGPMGGPLQPAGELVCGEKIWRFTVEGTGGPKRRICQFAKDRKYWTLPVPADLITLDPPLSCVKIPALVFNCTCKVKGLKLLVNGREPEGEPNVTVVAKLTKQSDSDGWTVWQGSLTFPSEGAWRVIYFLDGKLAATQMVVTGGGGLTATEQEAASLESRLIAWE